MRKAIMYVVWAVGMVVFMNKAIVCHKVDVKCSICGASMVVDQRHIKADICHMACLMEKLDAERQYDQEVLNHWRQLRDVSAK